jgi:hypothetical protein
LTEEPSPVGLADAEELEAREARGKRVAELIQKEIAMADAAPKECVAGLVDVVDESEDLCYIDDDAALVAKSLDASLPQPQSDSVIVAVNLGEGSGEKAQDPIDLDAPEAEESAAHASVRRLWCQMILTRQLQQLLIASHRSRRRHPMPFSLKTPI